MQHLCLFLVDVSNRYRARVGCFSTKNEKYNSEKWIQGPKDTEAWPLSREHTNSPDYPVVYELSACANQSPVGFIPYTRLHIIQILTAYQKIIKLVA